VPAISTGDIFRANVKEGTELGLRAQEFMNAGALVPDEVTNAMVRDRLAHPDAAQGFLLDGFPRNSQQAVELESMLAELGASLDAAVEITADLDVVTARLLKRAEIEGRADDTEPVIRERLAVYANSTAPLTAFYEGQGLLVQVDGLGDIDEVTERLIAALEAR
jgi:adenylate kinase